MRPSPCAYERAEMCGGARREKLIPQAKRSSVPELHRISAVLLVLSGIWFAL